MIFRVAPLLLCLACFPSRHSLEGRTCEATPECGPSDVCLLGVCQPARTTDNGFPARPLNEWSLAAPLQVARRSHQALEIGPGRLLVVGGRNAAGPVAEIELFDLMTNETRVVARLETARFFLAVTLLPDAQVLILGGVGAEGTPLKACEQMNLATGALVSCTPMAFARDDFFAFTLPDGRAWVVGSGDGVSTELWDPQQRTWTAGPRSQRNRVASDALQLRDGRVLITGNGVCEVYEHNPSTLGTLVRLAGCPTVSYNHATARLGESQVVLTGGTQQSTGPSLSRTDILDVSSLTWTQGPSLPEGREDHEMVTLPDGRAMVIGGFDNNASSIERIADALTLSPGASSWVPVDAPATPIQDHSVTIMNSGHVIRVGGDSPDGVTNTIEVFRP